MLSKDSDKCISKEIQIIRPRNTETNWTYFKNHQSLIYRDNCLYSSFLVASASGLEN